MKLTPINELPLLKEFEFKKIQGRTTGGFVYLPKEGGSLETKHYGFGQLILFHYLQPYFNKGESCSTGKLLQKLEKGQEKVLANITLGEEPFLLRTIRVFRDADLMRLEPANFSDFSSEGLLSKGANYDLARIECPLDLRPDKRFAKKYRIFRNF